MDKDYLIQKWLTEDLTEQEWEDFKQLEDYDLHIKLAENAKAFKTSNFSTVGSYEDFKIQRSVKQNTVKSLSWLQPLLRIAAVFVVALGIYFLFFFNSLTTIETIAGEKSTFNLPDATSVTLNAVSEISYNENEWSQKRELNLDGEAYFKVTKGTIFDVLTSNGSVRVLGTQFKVKTRTNFFEVACYEGIVSVTYQGKSKRLVAGQVYRVLDNVVFQDTISHLQPFWMQNKSSFKQVPFYEVLSEMERQYDISIQTTNINIDRVFTGGFGHDNLDQALEFITIPLGLTYNIQSKNRVVLKNSE